MTEERTHRGVPPPSSSSRAKGRSASICAATHAVSLEALPPPSGGASPDANRRRRPAARSQSARTANRRSVRTRPNPSTPSSNHHPNGGVKHQLQQQSTSEPKLAEQLHEAAATTPDVSPHIRRKGSQHQRRGAATNAGGYHQRKSTAFLELPETRGRGGSNNGSNAEEEEDEDSYRLRSFSFTSKGVFTNKTGIVNRGDSFRRRRSRSNSLCPPTGGPLGAGTPSPVFDEPASFYGGGGGGGAEVASYAVALLGAQGVGKTALISQFMTSECINAYDGQKDLLGAQTVSIMLNGEESELTFQNSGTMKDVDKLQPPDAFVVMYSVVDKASFLKAEVEMTRLQDADLLRSRPAILVANKIDLARSRAVSTQDGKCLACTFRAKFTEISVGINHNVDELLVGILTQIRLKVLHFEEGGHTAQWYKSRGMVKASMKARQMFTWLFGKEDSKFKNCENLHIL